MHLWSEGRATAHRHLGGNGPAAEARKKARRYVMHGMIASAHVALRANTGTTYASSVEMTIKRSTVTSTRKSERRAYAVATEKRNDTPIHNTSLLMLV